MQEKTIILDGFSKTYAMTGWRMGYGVLPEFLVDAVNKLMVNSNSCTASFTQRAGLAALRGPQEPAEAMIAEFRRRRDVFVEALNRLPGFRCPMPEGAFYAFPNIQGTGWRSRALADALLEQAGVACLSGTAFGAYGEGYVRFSYANSMENLIEAVGRIERLDGNIVDCATMPLPDGATLVTFQDITDTVNVERALRERNEALETADRLKIDFVHHVSYELRSPLTNIIGFAHFLGDPVTGPLTDKQREYLGYITVSTNALLAIINNILDLASIDAGAMTLNLGAVDVRRTMEAAAEGVQDRLVKNAIRLELRAAPDIGSFIADERRVRQTLFNLLANAVGFSPPGETVIFAAQRLKDALVFSVTDRGPGIPADVKDKVFDWFETHSLGSRHRGTGLGLSLVRSFVELHGGSVTLESAVGRGTTVTCVFPLDHRAQQSAA